MNSTQLIADRLTDLRLSRLPRFIVICAAVWVFFSIQYMWLGFHLSGFICSVEAAVSAIMLPYARGGSSQRYVTANIYLGSCCVSLFLLSLVTGQSASYAPTFLCCIGLLASHLMGSRSSVIWTFVAVTLLVFINSEALFGKLAFQQQHTIVDKTVYYVAATLLIFFLNWQAERFFKVQTSDLVALTDTLQERTRLLTLAEETARVGHWQWNVDTGEVRVSPEMCRVCGLPTETEELDLQTLLDQFSGPYRDRLERDLSRARDEQRPFTIDLSFSIEDSKRFLHCRGLPELDSDGKLTGVFGIFKDDTESQIAAEQLSEKAAALRELAAFDPLTGLSNRHSFHRQVRQSVANAESQETGIALLLLDLDGFKEINDTQGHPAGDAILKEVACRLTNCFNQEHLVARLGGDEFTVILEGVDDFETVLQMGRHVAATLVQPYQLNDREFPLGVSIGAAIYPQHSTSINELLSYADTAMYSAKRSQTHIAIYHPDMTRELVRRQTLESKLAKALHADEFRLLYQPQLDVVTNKIVGFEALLRWDHGDEVVSPDDFISPLETSHEICAVGRWVLIESCQQAQTWVEAGHDIQMSVNISPVQFRAPDIIDYILEALRSSGLAPNRLDLEITESVLIEEIEDTADKLFELRDLGVSVSIDDFGTGYCSLAYLRRFPLTRLKIDRTFIKDIPDQDDGIIASTIINLSRNLQLRVLAEGIEEIRQLDFLKQHGCHEYQGYFFSPPATVERCDALLEENKLSASGTSVRARAKQST